MRTTDSAGPPPYDFPVAMSTKSCRQKPRMMNPTTNSIATGPLTSPALSRLLGEILGGEYLYFYDAIAPIVDGETLDPAPLFWASRYGKGGGDDYLNVPLDRPGYEAFHRLLLEAEVLPLHDFERALFF